MKKIILLSLITLVTFTPQLYSISLAEYIKQEGMPQIRYNRLDLSNKNLTDLAGLQNIPGINQVTNLDLSHNQLQTIPTGTFDGLQDLAFLSLNNNQLQTLPDGVFNNLRSVVDLQLNNNQLQTLPARIFDDLETLMFLSLHNNQLQTLPDTIFSNLRILLELRLNNNRLQTLPTNIFNSLRDLSVLDLTGNPFSPDFIPTLVDMIRRMPRLETLNGMPKDQALREQPYSMLKGLTTEFIAKNIENYRPMLHTLPSDILDLLPLSPQERKEIDKKRAGQ